MFETFCDENKNPEDRDRRMKFRSNPQRFNSPVVGGCIKSHNQRLKIKAKSEPNYLSGKIIQIVLIFLKRKSYLPLSDGLCPKKETREIEVTVLTEQPFPF